MKKVLFIGTIHCPIDENIKAASRGIIDLYNDHLKSSVCFYEHNIIETEVNIADRQVYLDIKEINPSTPRYLDIEAGLTSFINKTLEDIKHGLDPLGKLFGNVSGQLVFDTLMQRLLANPEIIAVRDQYGAQAAIALMNQKSREAETWSLEIEHYGISIETIVETLDSCEAEVAKNNEALMNRDFLWKSYLDFESSNVTIVVGDNHIDKLAKWYKEEGYEIINQ